MNKTLNLACCLISLFCVSVFAAAPSKKVVDIQHWKTKNGAAVYFVRAPNLPMLDIRVVFSAGSAYDGKNYGLASLTNSMIGEGTKTQDANQIAKAFDNIGAQFGTAAGRDMAVVSLRSLTDTKYLNPALSEFSNVLTKTSFPLKALQRVKNRTVAAIKVQQQDPGDVASNAFFNAVYRDQVYAHQPLGTISIVKKLTKEQLQDFYQQYYVAKNADIIMVGDLSLKQAKRVARHISQYLPEGRVAKQLKPAAALTKEIYRRINFPAKQTSIVIGQVGITRANPDYFPLIVGNYVFGGLPLESILFQQIRNKRGLSYDARSGFQLLRYKGPFIISLQTRASKSKEALAVVQQTLRDYLKKGPTEKQLNAAKQNLVGGFPLALSTNSKIIGIITRIAFYHRPLNYLDTYRAKVRAVTREQVRAAFDKLIKPGKMAIISVGPALQPTPQKPKQNSSSGQAQ